MTDLENDINPKSDNDRPHSNKELAVKYRVSPRTVKRWTKPLEAELGPRIGHQWSLRQVRIIWERLGAPLLWWLGSLFVSATSANAMDAGDQAAGETGAQRYGDDRVVAPVITGATVIATKKKTTWWERILMACTAVVIAVWFENWDRVKYFLISLF